MTPLMKFNPKWIGLTRPPVHGEGIEFDCPNCGAGHRLCAYFSNPLDGEAPASWQKPTWKREGSTFGTLTLTPSIQYPCFHGWVEDGQVIDISESPMTIVMPGKGRMALSPRQVKMMTVRKPNI